MLHHIGTDHTRINYRKQTAQEAILKPLFNDMVGSNISSPASLGLVRSQIDSKARQMVPYSPRTLAHASWCGLELSMA
jgi:hypothetical protein